MKAQDFISNSNGFGSYANGTGSNFQNVIINNTPNNPISWPVPPNDINGQTTASFVGGADSEINGTSNRVSAYSLLYGIGSEINGSVNTIAIGEGNTLSNSINSLSIGQNNSLQGTSAGEGDRESMFTIGSGNTITEFDGGVAIGQDNLINGKLFNGKGAFTIGKRLTTVQPESMVLGFGSESNRLTQVGKRSITLGTYNETTNEAFNAFNIQPPSSSDDFTAPVVGIGTIQPDAKLNIVNRGAIEGEAREDPSTSSVALRVERFRDLRDNIELFNVRNDGAAGFNIPANPNRPRAPYQFEKSDLKIFRDPNNQGQFVDGEANIVQNYNSFPFFQSTSPDEENAKWLALGERPPGAGTEQVAYGLANVWNNTAGNFVLLDQTPQDQEEPNSDAKDLAITFQDVGTGGELEEPEEARNRLRFLFRNSRRIEQSNSTFELMSLEPTGEVGIGDYSGNSTQQANLEVKAETSGNGDPVFQVRNNGGPGSRGNNILTVNDDGRVGIGLTNPNDQLEITSGDPIKPGGGDWDQPSDRRLKKSIRNYNDGLDEVMEINPVWYQYNSKMKHVDSNEKHVGVIAQETKEVATYMVDKSYKVDSKTYYSMNSSAFTYMLINAVQKQQKQLKEEQSENDSMRQALKNQQEQLNNQQQQMNKQQEQIEQLRERLNRLAVQKDGNANRFKKSDNLNEKTVSISSEDGQKQAMLLQNRPNPYSGETIIPYYLPKDFETANLLITNTNGQIIKRVNLEQPGKGELTLRTMGLNAGQYFYSLTVDGQKIQTRKMVRSRK